MSTFERALGSNRDGTYPEDDCRGCVGWVVVAEGCGGGAVVVDYDGDFGALRWAMEGLGDRCEDLGMAEPGAPGIYRVTMRAHGPGDDMTFDAEGEWETLWEPTGDMALTTSRCRHPIKVPPPVELRLFLEHGQSEFRQCCVTCGRHWERRHFYELRDVIRKRYPYPEGLS